MPFPCWIFDPRTLKFLEVNRCAVEHYGYSYEEFIHQLTIEDIRPEDDRRLVRKTVARLKDGVGTSNIWRHRKSDGEIFYVRIFSCSLDYKGIKARLVSAINVDDQIRIERRARKLHFMVARQKEQLESILSSLKEVVWTVRPDDLRIRYINPACEDLYGYTAEEIMKDSSVLLDRIHPEDQLLIPELKEKLIREKSLSVEFRIIHRDGTIKHVWNQCHMIFSPSGKPLKITGSSVDVTDQRTAELALEVKARQTDEIFESISDVFFVLDKQMNFVYLNRVFEETYNVNRRDLLGKNIWDHFKAARSYKYYAQFNKALDEQVTVEFEEYAPSIDRWLFVKAYPFSQGLAIYFRNVTREKELRERLKKDTQNMRAMIDNTEDLIWSLDENLRLLSFNQAYQNWFTRARGRQPKIGDTELSEEYGVSSYHRWKQYYNKVLSGFAFKVIETEVVNDLTRYLECSFRPIKDKDGSIWGLSCFSKDITDYRNKIEEVERQNQKLKDIAWLQSHKVRSPVATILGLTQLVNKEDFADPGNQVLLDHIETAAITLDEVIHMIVRHTDELHTPDTVIQPAEQNVVLPVPYPGYGQKWPGDVPVPDNDAERLRALYSYKILDTPAEKQFLEITSIAAKLCDAPLALISFVDQNRQWYLPHPDFPVAETPRDVAFCSYAIMDPSSVFIVGDAYDDDRFKYNPMVREEPYIRFYAGAPLVTSEGYAIGVLSVIDKNPGGLGDEQQKHLRALADQVMSLLELRKMKLSQPVKQKVRKKG